MRPSAALVSDAKDAAPVKAQAPKNVAAKVGRISARMESCPLHASLRVLLVNRGTAVTGT
jgi:hypothetical protein